MIKLLIADDEKVMREALNAIIDWKALGIEIVGLCKNGVEAYDTILDEYPDIVITDINMPGFSGLDLILKIQQISSDIQFIILSGYSDFEYAKQAMKLGIKHYLLKPCNENEIIDVVNEVKKEIVKGSSSEITSQNFALLKLLYESVMQNLIVESLKENPCFDKIEQKYEKFISFKYTGYEICSMTSNDFQTRESFISEFRDKHDKHSNAMPLYCIQSEEKVYLGFESYDYSYKELDSFFDKYNDFKRISVNSLEQYLIKIHNEMSTQKKVYIGFNKKSPTQDETKTNELLLSLQNSDYIAKVIEIVELHIGDSDLSLKKISEQYLYMNVDYLSRKFLKTTGKKFSAYLAEARINKAKQMLLSDDIKNVNAVAEAVGCGNNPQYFSHLFKKITGQTPTEFLKNQA